MKDEKRKIISDICPLYKEYGTCEQCNTELDIDGEPCYFECMANHIIRCGYSKQSEGEWLVSEFPLTASKKVKCSECGYIEHRGPAWNISWGMHKYCPNCGAKMKGGE